MVWVISRAAHAQTAVGGVPNRLNYCAIFIIYTEFTNVAAVRIIQSGGPWVRYPWAVTSGILIVAVTFTVFTRTLFLTRRVEMCVVCTISHVPRIPVIPYLSPWDRNRQQIFTDTSCHFLQRPGRSKTSLQLLTAIRNFRILKWSSHIPGLRVSCVFVTDVGNQKVLGLVCPRTA